VQRGIFLRGKIAPGPPLAERLGSDATRRRTASKGAAGATRFVQVVAHPARDICIVNISDAKY
jgi:hypothetical protein